MAENHPQDGEEPEGTDAEQDLLVVLPLSNRSMGTAADRMAIEALAEELSAILEESGVGEYDGEEIGGGSCTLFFAGPDPRRILQVIQPVLRHSPFGRGAEAILGYGDDGKAVRTRI